MRNSIIILFIFLTAISCDEKEQNPELLGNWESFERPQQIIYFSFYKDSLITDMFQGDLHTVSNWSSDDSKIYLKNITLSDSIINRKLIYNYELNITKDTLLIELVDGEEDEFSTFKKVEVNPYQK